MNLAFFLSKRHSLKLPNCYSLFLLVVTSCFLSASVSAKEIEFDARMTLRYQYEGERDLGVKGQGDQGVIAGLFQPRVRGFLSESWYVYSYADFFAADDVVELDEGAEALRSKGYVALRELWVEYSGLGRYPGETFRIGLERLREESALWWDTELLLARWRLETTLLNATFGVGEKLTPASSDDLDLPSYLANRTRVFTEVEYQWFPGHWLGAKVLYSDDRETEARNPLAQNELLYGLERKLIHAGASLNNGYYTLEDKGPWQYTIDVQLVNGTSYANLSEDQALQGKQDVSGWAADLGVRYQLPPMFGSAWSMNAGYHLALSTGSDGVRGNDAADASYTNNNFQQSGLHANRSRFTGVRTREARFGESVRPELFNLNVHTLYLSQDISERVSWSLIFHKYVRHSADAPIRFTGLSVQPSTTSKDLGSELDFSTTVFSRKNTQSIWSNSYIRLRAGYFNAGNAFSGFPNAEKIKFSLDVQKRI